VHPVTARQVTFTAPGDELGPGPEQAAKPQ